MFGLEKFSPEAPGRAFALISKISKAPKVTPCAGVEESTDAFKTAAELATDPTAETMLVEMEIDGKPVAIVIVGLGGSVSAVRSLLG